MAGLVTQDWQVEFDGLLLGAGTPYYLTSLKGFLDLAGVRAPMTQRPRQHGGYIEPHYASGATRDLDFNIQGTSSVAFTQAVNTLRAQTYPQATTRPLWVQLPGVGLLTAQAQVINRSIPVIQEYTAGLVTGAALQFYMPDPFWYGPTQSGTTGLPSTSGGLVYPLSYPLAYGTTVSGAVSCRNVGSEATPPLFTVVGPISPGFTITSIEDQLSLTYTGALGANDTVVINTADGSVWLNTVSDRRQNLAYSTWPSIPAANPATGAPGVRTFAFTTTGSATAATMTVSWAPAYV